MCKLSYRVDFFCATCQQQPHDHTYRQYGPTWPLICVKNTVFPAALAPNNKSLCEGSSALRGMAGRCTRKVLAFLKTKKFDFFLNFQRRKAFYKIATWPLLVCSWHNPFGLNGLDQLEAVDYQRLYADAKPLCGCVLMLTIFWFCSTKKAVAIFIFFEFTGLYSRV